MKLIETPLSGSYLVDTFKMSDNRGNFCKPYSHQLLDSYGLQCDFKESYYSSSISNVIRGMHFQLPPHDHVKLVYVTSGKILDVILDLRLGSETYGQTFSTILSGNNGKAIYIGKGFAHGFATLANNSIVTYLQTTEHSATHDTGVRYDSINFVWPIVQPILSERDLQFESLSSFKSPFSLVGHV